MNRFFPRRARLPCFMVILNAPPDVKKQREMDLYDRMPAHVRRVIQEQGNAAFREYLMGNVSRFNNAQEGSEYDGWE